MEENETKWMQKELNGAIWIKMGQELELKLLQLQIPYKKQRDCFLRPLNGAASLMTT